MVAGFGKMMDGTVGIYPTSPSRMNYGSADMYYNGSFND